MKLILAILLALALPAVAARPKPFSPKPTPAMARQRTAAEDARLRDWIVGIQTEARLAVASADKAEAEAQASRAQSAIAALKLTEAEGRLMTVDKAFATVSDERDTARAHDARTTKRNALLTNIVGAEAALALALVMLWLRVPSMGPWGLAATCFVPVLAFGAVKLMF